MAIGQRLKNQIETIWIVPFVQRRLRRCLVEVFGGRGACLDGEALTRNTHDDDAIVASPPPISENWRTSCAQLYWTPTQ